MVSGARQVCSPNYDDRPVAKDVGLWLIHGISLPPAEFGGPYVEQLFCNKLNPTEHPYFADISHLQVSSHLFVRRDGELIQFVSLDKRAWHAGESSFMGRDNCNDYSIGIELEGTDDEKYTHHQYDKLAAVTIVIMQNYPGITHENVCGHCDVAPKRKTDPGLSFDWVRYRNEIAT